jgi:hypothetical protein
LGHYADLTRAVAEGRVRHSLEPCPDGVVAALRQQHPEVPVAFTSFLEEVGRGSIGKSSYMIYGGLLSPDEIYDEETARELEGALLFGDDFSGYNAGFLTREGWRLVEIGPGGLERLHRTFETFIRRRFVLAMEQK